MKYYNELLKFEYKYLVKLLVKMKGNLTNASRHAGLQRHQLRRMMNRNKVLIRKPAPFGMAQIKGPEGWTAVYRK